MWIKRISILLTTLLMSGLALAAGEADLQIRAAKPGATVAVDRVMEDGKLLVSVMDEGKNPLFGLTAGDFTVTQAGRAAKITSVKPIAESLDVPRHIVMVLDNSSSMVQREAVQALLAGVDELLKIVRPIDDVQVVVFASGKTVSMGGRELHVQTFRSNQPSELRDFTAKIYRDGVISETVLYEGMLAGLDLIGKIPAGEPRFMVVFSDGEDINSAFKREDVFKAAQGLERFNAFAIDYMPGSATDKFLAEFARQNSGQVWKATSETNLVPIFQNVASKMQYYYVVSYLFPPTGGLAVAPASLSFDEIRAAAAVAPAGQAPALPAKEVVAVASVLDTTSEVPMLMLRPTVDSAYGIASWKVAVSNAKGSVTELSGEGAPPAELKVPLPTADLPALAAGGDLAVKMELQDRKGQSLTIGSTPVKVTVAQVKASLAVAPASLTIDEVRTAAVATRIDQATLTLRPTLEQAYWIARWKVIVSNVRGSVAELSGQGAPTAELKVPLPTGDLPALAAGGDLAVKLELQGRRGQSLAVIAQPVKLKVVQTRASLAVEPASLTIEEIKTIDASPMLGQIYFATGSSEIALQYARFSGPAETVGFDEQKFRDTLEKYYQLLNIVGKRLTDNPGATVKLVGCNDNTGAEKGKKKLSGERAEAVRNYLQAVWNIAPERLSIEARNLPQLPSTSKSKEGQAENRRVEILSSDPAILAPIRSTYLTTRIDKPALLVRPDVDAPYGIATWKVTATNSSGNLADLSGSEAPAKETRLALPDKDLRAMAAGGDITVKMALQDRAGQQLELAPVPVKVNFVETSKRLALKQDQRVQEKYALILFDFDKDTISAGNQEIVNKIVARIKSLPQAIVEITGHTDNIGKEAYNIKLSERRAQAVYKMLTAAYGEAPGELIRATGVGPNSPLYDNQLPEGRSFNRTVTITLEYLSAD